MDYLDKKLKALHERELLEDGGFTKERLTNDMIDYLNNTNGFEKRTKRDYFYNLRITHFTGPARVQKGRISGAAR